MSVKKVIDRDFLYLLKIDPAFEQWRGLAAEWSQQQTKALVSKATSLNAFFVKYLHGMQIDKNPTHLFEVNRDLPDLWTVLQLGNMSAQTGKGHQGTISDFLEWVLRNRLSNPSETSDMPLRNPFPRITAKRIGKLSDITLSHVIQRDPTLVEWQKLAAEWMQAQSQSVGSKRDALDRFLVRYISALNLDRNPIKYLSRSTQKPSFNDTLIRQKHRGVSGALSSSDVRESRHVNEFIQWVLLEKLSIEDGHGSRIVPPQLHNPVERLSNSGIVTPTESVRSSLSIRYIKELRTMLAEGPTFRDWIWAQNCIESWSHRGDWFVVAPHAIDRDDPDCVWRERETSNRERQQLGLPETVVELWSPVRAVALYIKLELPLRTFQVRMLDSGEADTWRYQYTTSGGQFSLSQNPLSIGSEKRPYQRGVFHRAGNEAGASLFVNTNKTADINKQESAKGYVIPWTHNEVLYWLEKLRNWQERYNPITGPTAWATLESRHLGRTAPDTRFLEERGATCFLFRDASGDGDDRGKPILHSRIDHLWQRLLNRLEERCIQRGESINDGTPIHFLDRESRNVTLYPLHSLRVSLISYLVLDLQLPLPVVSKMIAGHARIIMTLYYTKFGQAYMREVLEEAEKAALEADQKNHLRFLNDSTFDQVSARFASMSVDGLKVAIKNKSRAMFVVEDKGICPVGGGMCDVGGSPIGDKQSDIVFGPVPGYPNERNCVRCRFFITGPAFLPGMVAHFNALSYAAHETSERHNTFQEEVTLMENRRADCQTSGQLFTEGRELERLYQRYEAEAEALGKLVNDMQACNHLIGRSIQILEAEKKEGMALVAAGALQDVKAGFVETPSELYQLEVLCENAVIYPATDARKPVLRRSQLLDCMLMANNMAPVMLKLSERQQHLVGNAVMELIQARAGSLQNALEYVEGMRRLSELGIVEDNVHTLASGIPAKELVAYARSKQPLLQKVVSNAP